MKNYHRISLIGLLTTTLFFSCSKDEDNLQIQPEDLNSCAYILDANPEITTLTPETIHNLCAPNAMALIKKGSSQSYTLIVGRKPVVAQWNVQSGSGITFNDGELTATGAVVKINFSNNFTAGSVKAVGTLSSGEMYGPILNFKAGRLF